MKILNPPVIRLVKALTNKITPQVIHCKIDLLSRLNYKKSL
jgi:hypothetical protein